MKILYVDDERSAHIIFKHTIEDCSYIATTSYHFNSESALEYASTHQIDCAFLDISLPDKDGIQLAKELLAMQPNIELAFITGYDDYAREAYKVGGRAYLAKPYEVEDLKNVLNLMNKLCKPPVLAKEPLHPEVPHIFAKTFGFFDLMVDGQPVFFKNAKSKELLAYLIYQMGSSVSNAQVFFALWEQQEYSRTTSTYVRRTIRALKVELECLGIEDILVCNRNSIHIDKTKISCDAYDLFNGSLKEASLFNYEYMSQYSWGEATIPLLERAAVSLLNEQTNF